MDVSIGRFRWNPANASTNNRGIAGAKKILFLSRPSPRDLSAAEQRQYE